MLDKENEVYTRIVERLEDEFGHVFCGQVEINDDTKFPYVYIEQTDSYERPSTIDSSGVETARNVRFAVNVYSNKSKSETKSIMEMVKLVMRGMNFICTADVPTQIGTHREIYRRSDTFEGTVTNDTFYRF